MFLPDGNITDLTTSWTDGIALSLLVNKLCPGVIPNVQSLDPAEALSNIEQAMKLSTSYFQIPQV